MKKILFLIVLAGCSTGIAFAQPINRATPEANLKAAEEAVANNNPYAALDLYEKVYESNKDKNVAAKVAKLNYDLRDYEKAEKGFSRLVLRDRKQEFTELKYWYAMAMKFNAHYAEAVDMFNQYVAEGKDPVLVASSKVEIVGSELGKKAKQPDNLLVANIGKKANSPQTESSPSYSGGELYYSSLLAKDVVTLDGKQGDWYAKVMTSNRAGVEFSDPTPLGEQINREGWHQGNVSVTPDGKTMYFTRVQIEEKGQTLQESKIYYSPKGADGWGAAKEVAGVNGDYIAKHPCEGDLFGERVLFFVASMPGGKGGYDLYYAPKKAEGQFGLPVNLGDVINTAGEEASPFYRDGKLYFSSNGRPTLGGLDVFESQWNGSKWSEPKVLPLGVNTSLDDQYYTQAADGMSGFVVSNRPGPNNLKSKTCCDDIYAWEFERIKVNLNALTFRRKRVGEKDNQPLNGSTVQVIDVTDKNPVNVEEKTNAATNDFAFMLIPDKSYRVIAVHEGYVPDTLEFNTVGVKKTITVDKKLTLRMVKPVKVEPDSIVVTKNEPIRLNKIYYDYDDDKILAESEPDLQFLVDLMNKYPEMTIELSSHTDSRGKDDYNERLSQRRADSAKRWMVAKGIKDVRITPKGYGETQILNGCINGEDCEEDDHRFNRRTEFKILSGPTSITIQRKEEKKPVDKKTGKPGGKN